MTRILLTGFEPFGGHATNPSAAVVNALASAASSRGDLVARVLPTVYAESGRIVRELIAEHRPGAVLCLGLCARSDAILLERLAVNLNDDACGDNAGDCARGRVIVPEGPVGYWSTLPLEAMHDALQARGVPMAWSNSAGTYVCNHVFYTARHTIEQLGLDARCGFVHLPQVVGEGRMSLAALVDAVRVLVAMLSDDTPER